MSKHQPAKDEEAKQLVDKLAADAVLFNKYRSFMKYEKLGLHCVIEYHQPSTLPKAWAQWMLNLTRTNMKAQYDACPGWGWKEREKRQELRDSAARFLVALPMGPGHEENAVVHSNGQESRTCPIAFVHFRFEVEEHNAIIYLYELQTESAYQGKGLGRFLMRLLELVAWQSNLKEFKLTVMESNKGAQHLYRSLGYTLSSDSPSAVSLDSSCGYDILVKANPRLHA